MQIRYVLGTYPTLLQNMVAKVYEAADPLAEVSSIILPEVDAGGIPTPGAGHQASVTVTFTGLDRVPHILKLFTAGGTQLQDFNVEPTEDIITVFDPIFFKIGDGAPLTPVAGQNSYINTGLAGSTNMDMFIYRNGAIMFPGVHYDTDLAGGFHLLQAMDVFGADEEYILHRKSVIIKTPVNDSVVGKQWGPTAGNANIFVDVVSNVSYLPIHLKKLIRISGAGIYNFNAPVPRGYPLRFSNQVGGTGTITFSTAPLITPAGDVTTFNVPVGMIAEFVFDGAKFNLTQLSSPPVVKNSIIATGSVNIGDISYNVLKSVTFADIGTLNYKIFGTVVSNTGTNTANDCTIIFDINKKRTNGFDVVFREEVGVIQNVSWDWIAVLPS